MKTDYQTHQAKTVFLQTVGIAVTQLKQQLQRDYEKSYPELREIIHLVLNEEESLAWDLTEFPHLLLPDLVEAHVARLDLQPVETRHSDVFATHGQNEFENDRPVLALCA